MKTVVGCVVFLLFLVVLFGFCSTFSALIGNVIVNMSFADGLDAKHTTSRSTDALCFKGIF